MTSSVTLSDGTIVPMPTEQLARFAIVCRLTREQQRHYLAANIEIKRQEIERLEKRGQRLRVEHERRLVRRLERQLAEAVDTHWTLMSWHDDIGDLEAGIRQWCSAGFECSVIDAGKLTVVGQGANR